MMNPSYRYRLNGRLTYTEPVSKYSQVSLGYRTSYNYQQSDKKTYRTGEDYDITGLLPDPLLSNAYKSSYTVHSLGPGFNYSKDRNTFAANVYYQRSSLSGEVIRTGSEEIKHAYNNVTYFMVGQFNLNRENTLRMFLRSYTDNPEVTQLQNVYDVSDAQYITRGNPDLRPSYSHNLSMHYVNSNAEKGRTFMLMFRAETTQDYITTSTRYRPTLEIDNTVYRPLQFTEWTNMDGYWDVRARASYGFPVNFIKSNLNLRGGVSYSRIPSLVDGERNNTGNLGYEAGVVLGSNISENVDFTLFVGRHVQRSRQFPRRYRRKEPLFQPSGCGVVQVHLRPGILPLGQRFLYPVSGFHERLRRQLSALQPVRGQEGLSQPAGGNQHRRKRHFQSE